MDSILLLVLIVAFVALVALTGWALVCRLGRSDPPDWCPRKYPGDEP